MRDENASATLATDPVMTDTPYFQFSVDTARGDFALRGNWTLPNLGEVEEHIDTLQLADRELASVNFRCASSSGPLRTAWALA